MENNINVKVIDIARGYAPIMQLSQVRMSPVAAMQVRRISKAVEAEYRLYHETWMDLLKEYAILDDGGEPVSENGKYQFEEDNKGPFEEKYQELIDSPVSLPVRKLRAEEIISFKVAVPEDDNKVRWEPWTPSPSELEPIAFILDA